MFSQVHQQMLSKDDTMYRSGEFLPASPKGLSAMLMMTNDGSTTTTSSNNNTSAGSSGYISPMQLHYQTDSFASPHHQYLDEFEPMLSQKSAAVQPDLPPSMQQVYSQHHHHAFQPQTVSPQDAMLKSPQDEYYGKAFDKVPSLFATDLADYSNGPQFIYPNEQNSWAMEEPEAMDEDDDDDDDDDDFDDDAEFDDVLFSSDDDMEDDLYDYPQGQVPDLVYPSGHAYHQAQQQHVYQQQPSPSQPQLHYRPQPHSQQPSQLHSHSIHPLHQQLHQDPTPSPEVNSPLEDEQATPEDKDDVDFERTLKKVPKQRKKSVAKNQINDEMHAFNNNNAGGMGPHRCTATDSKGNECGKVFSRPYDLIRHQDTIHAAVRKTFRCDICGDDSKTFSRMDALSRHVRVKHSAKA